MVVARGISIGVRPLTTAVLRQGVETDGIDICRMINGWRRRGGDVVGRREGWHGGEARGRRQD
jgi:hypothetical protein